MKIACSLPLLIASLVLPGCTVAVGPQPGFAQGSQPGAAPGYQYHDGNHPNDVSLASPEAIYNAQHGTWLWPPASTGRRD